MICNRNADGRAIGGTAGLAMAGRLTESGTQNVLVLEAGQAPTAVATYKAPGADQLVLGTLITCLPKVDISLTSFQGHQLTGRSPRFPSKV